MTLSDTLLTIVIAEVPYSLKKLMEDLMLVVCSLTWSAVNFLSRLCRLFFLCIHMYEYCVIYLIFKFR